MMMRRFLKLRVLSIVAVCGILLPALLRAQGDSLFFPETQHSVSGRFLSYWRNEGGLPVFGYPITEQRPELNGDTGNVYETQWFERNRFELHPENRPPYDILLGRLGD